MNHIIYYPNEWLIYLNHIHCIYVQDEDIAIFGTPCDYNSLLRRVDCGSEDAANKLLEGLMKFPPANDDDYVFNVKRELEDIEKKRKREHERE